MPILNLGTKHMTPEDATAFDLHLAEIERITALYAVNFSPEERQRYGSINETNKLFVNKVMDYHQNQPALDSPDVDWKEMENDRADRIFSEARIARFNSVTTQWENYKIAHDYDNYQNALLDYDFTKYKMGTANPAFETKYNELRQFFPNTGGGNNAATKPETTNTTTNLER